jgi:GNAT superfamily N-acetyltransferase
VESDRVHIRLASDADIPEMHRIRMRVRENRLLDPATVQPDDYRRVLTPAGQGWVAEVDGRIVGFAIADLAGSNIWALFVDPTAEGRGIGRGLHDRMMDSLFAAGAERIWLSTDAGSRAERFYRAACWRHVSTAADGAARYELSRLEWLARPAGSR